MQVSLPNDRTLQRGVHGLVAVLATLWIALALGLLVVPSLGTDEAWVLMGFRSLLQPPVADLSSALIATNGGPFALMQIAIEAALGPVVWAHRAPSLVLLLAALGLVAWRLRDEGVVGAGPWIALAPMGMVPGLAEQGTAALGTSAGLFFMVAGLLTAKRMVLTPPRWGPALWSGLWLGLAATCRAELVLALPALLIWASLEPVAAGRLKLKAHAGAWLATAIGLALYALNFGLMSLPTNAVDTTTVADATGMTSPLLDYPKLLNHWAILGSFVPLGVLGAAAMAALASTSSGQASFAHNTQEPALASATARWPWLLLLTGLLLLLAWVFRSPVPHLRYAMPGLVCFAWLGCLALARWLAVAPARRSLLASALAATVLVGNVGNSLRYLLMADADIASWEWSQESSRDYFRRLDAGAAQRDAARFLREGLAPGSMVYAHVPYALRYLSLRAVRDVSPATQRQAGLVAHDRYMVLTPANGTYLFLPPSSQIWLTQQATLVYEAGRYSVYRLPPGREAELEVLESRRIDYAGHPLSKPWFGR